MTALFVSMVLVLVEVSVIVVVPFVTVTTSVVAALMMTAWEVVCLISENIFLV